MKALAKSYTKGSISVVNVKIGGVVSLDLSVLKEALHCLGQWKVFPKEMMEEFNYVSIRARASILAGQVLSWQFFVNCMPSFS